MPLLCCNPSLLRIQSATSHLSLSLPGTCSWMKSAPGHTLKTPKPLGCGEHRENPQIKPSVHNLTCAKGSFHPDQLLPPPGVAVPIGAQAQLPGLRRLHQIPTSSRASSRAGELAGEPEYLALCLGPACWAEFEFWQQIYPQETLRGLFQPQLTQAQGQTLRASLPSPSQPLHHACQETLEEPRDNKILK